MFVKFTTKQTPEGNVELFKDGVRVATGTREAIETRIQTEQSSAVETPGGTVVDPGTGSVIGDSTVRRHVPATPTDVSGVTTPPSETDVFLGGLDITPPTEAEKETIRERELAAIESQIEGIEATTVTLLRGEEKRALRRTGQTRARSARGGRLTSEFGAREAGRTEDINKEAREAIIVQQNERKLAVFDKARERAVKAIEFETTKALASADIKIKFLADQQEEAREDLKTLAATGVDIDSFTDQEYDTLVKGSGYSPMVFDAVYNASTPGAQKREYHYQNLGEGRVLRFDKAGGEPEEFDYSVPSGFEFTMADDVPVWINKDTQEVRVITEIPIDRDVPAGDFSSTQRNKGAANAGVSISVFNDYDADTQNTFINGDIAGTKEDIEEAIKTEGASIEDINASIDDLNLTPTVTTFLKDFATSISEKGPTSSPENTKTLITNALTDLKAQGLTRKEAQTKVEDTLGTDLPKVQKDALKDALVEVFGRTVFQKIIPGGR